MLSRLPIVSVASHIAEQVLILSLSLHLLTGLAPFATLSSTSSTCCCQRQVCDERLLHLLVHLMLWLSLAAALTLAMAAFRSAAEEGGGLLNLLVDLSPCELHLPGTNFTGPGTDLKRRTRKGTSGRIRWRRSSRPSGPVDEAAFRHDVAYLRAGGDGDARRRADERMLDEVEGVLFGEGDERLPAGELAVTVAVWLAMTVKCALH